MNNRLYSLRSKAYSHILDDPDARRKVQLFGAMLPGGCRSVLDVGGASGWATLAIRMNVQVVTLDRDLPSLLAGDGCRVLADASHLPFADHSFDLVLSSQVLEHLPKSVFDTAREDMVRVTTRFLLVSVPYREDMSARTVQCGYCGQVFHTNHHVRAFCEQDLAVLFRGWIMAEWHVFGVLNEASGLASVKGISLPRIKQRVRIPDEHTVCPSCGGQGAAANQNPAAAPRPRRGLRRIASYGKQRVFKFLTALQRPAFLPQAKAPYWIAALFIPGDRASVIDSDIDSFHLRD